MGTYYLMLNILLHLSRAAEIDDPKKVTTHGGWANRIIVGEPAFPHEYPWLVTLDITAGEENFRCGGALISMDTVLTAAHCLYDASSVKVYAGEHDLFVNEGTEQTSETTSYTVHEEFDNVTLSNDVALLNFSKPFVRTAAVSPLKLPSPYFKCNESGIVVGWGRTDNKNPPSLPTTLHTVTLPIRSGHHCKKQVQGKYRFCAGWGNRKDLCKGDSGSPFICKSKPNTIYGIVSGISTKGYCAVRYWPAIFTRVPAYIPWIRSKLRLHKIYNTS